MRKMAVSEHPAFAISNKMLLRKVWKKRGADVCVKSCRIILKFANRIVPDGASQIMKW